MSVSLDFGLLALLYYHSLHYEKFPDGAVKCIEDEIPFDLPDGWEWCRISEVIELYSGQDLTPDRYNDTGKGIPYITGASNLSDGSVIVNRWTDSPTVHSKSGDLLLTCKGSGVGKMAFSDIEDAHIARQIMALRCKPSIDRYYLQIVVSAIINDITAQANGIIPGIRREIVLASIIPLPPYNEQKKIAEHVQSALSLLKNIETDKDDLKNTIQLTKSKILDLAIRGKLVPQNPDDEPASVLLDRIRAKKEELIKQGKIKRDKKESVIYKGDDNSYYEVIASKTTNIDDDLPFELPDGWEWCRLGSIIDICSSKRVLQSEWKKEGVPFYRAREIVKLSETGRVDNDLFISEEHYQNLKKDYGIPKSGDLMVSGVGTIGKVYIVCENDKFYYKDASVLCFQNTYNALYPLYAKLLIDSSFMQKQMSDNSKGTTVDTITISTATTYLCILPPINEQKRIADKVSQLFSLLDSIAENVN